MLTEAQYLVIQMRNKLDRLVSLSQNKATKRVAVEVLVKLTQLEHTLYDDDYPAALKDQAS